MKSTNKNTKWTIYVHTNLLTGRSYVGQTTKKPEYRWGKNGNGYKNQRFYKYIEYYGWDNFSHEILEVVYSQEEADEKEKYYIEKYECITEGYNCIDGGVFATTKSKMVECEGIVFDSIAKCAEYYGVNKSYLNKCLNGKVPMSKLWNDRNLRYFGDTDTLYEITSAETPRNSKRVECDGVIYNTMRECSREIGISISNISIYLRQKRLPKNLYDRKLKIVEDNFEEYAYFTEEDVNKNKCETNRNKKVTCENRIFKNTTDCARYYGEKSHRLQMYLSGKTKMPLEWYERGLRFYGDTETVYEVQTIKRKSNIQIEYDGIIYDTITKCAKACGINRHTLSKYLEGNKPLPDYLKNKGLRLISN